MKKYLGETGLKSVLGKLKGELGLKADKSDLTWHSNQNLLDNWYFLNPVNQRGQTEYTAHGYSIDRWLTTHNAKAALGSSGITLTSSTEKNSGFTQFLSDSVRAAIKGQTVTYSVLLDNGLFSKTVKIPESVDFDFANSKVGAGEWYFDMYSTGNQGRIIFRMTNDSTTDTSSITAIAAKLELGSRQTLAHKEGDQWVLNDPPPNYQQELAKCQRYQYSLPMDAQYAGRVSNNVGTNILFTIPIPVPMRLKNLKISNESHSITAYYNGNNQKVTIKQVSTSENSVIAKVDGTIESDLPVKMPLVINWSAINGSIEILDANI